MKGVYSMALALLFAALAFLPTAARAQNGAATGPPNYGDKEVEAKFVGVSGGVIAGAEVVIALEAIIGVRKTWPYLTFPLLGAAAGGVGGYFLEKQSPKGAVALLVSSLALVIPTALAASAATAYHPEDEGASAEAPAGAQFSFEANPTNLPAENAEATTEVEARPENAPADGALPAPGGETAPEAAPPAQPAPSPAPAQPAPAPAPPSSGGATAKINSHRTAPVVTGSLFQVDPSRGGASFGVPFVDVRPSALTDEAAILGVRPGLEVRIPLLSINLP